ncbi:alcohol dehydrogenase catalytic domain-containing protein [Lacticaseibacillus camelliae]|uniref:Oxidoreductase n=1 Tax=Lacticaseibacillus camelliae DSM 22697 = JCM 13995 TaxID=1423730 RepID=A0A0R2ESD5_9LACO|nr:zinc-binding dehydrogenase [Lacticaseibacillus camelliae]KRN18675.1 oxidoreductase [Lacticaseibacillus camelliae DSM 22697 = JCM 13995]
MRAETEKMQAAYFTQVGNTDEIEVGQLPVPSIGPADVLVRIREAAVNRVDAYVRSGAFKTPLQPQQIIGRDAWGTVAAVGAEVTAFHVGDRVWTNSMGYGGRQGITAQFATIPEARLFAMPDGDPSNWLALVHPGATAAIIVTQLLKLQPGQTLLAEGGAGHVGRMLIQCAKICGLHVIATANPRDFVAVTALGAEAIDYAPGWEKKLDRPVDAIIDSSGRVPLQLNLDQLAVGGQIILIAATKEPKVSFDLPRFYMNEQRLRGFVISRASLASLTQANQWLLQHAATFAPLTVEQLSLNDAAKAHAMVMDPQVKTRLLITLP